MKLYYTPGSCSLAPHIALREAGADFVLERVDPASKRTDADADFLQVNPKGYVPVLGLDDGQVLTEGPAILQFIADRHPASGLAPAAGSLERSRLQEQLNFIASELHKAFSPLFSASASEPEKQAARDKVARRLETCEALLADGRPYLQGERFSVADAYLFVVARWAEPTGVGLARWPHIAAHGSRVGERASVQQALRAEGLLN